MPTERETDRFIYLAVCCRIDDKQEFRRLAAKHLRELAEQLGLYKGDFDLRYNPGGIAVMGDVTLHADWLYLNLTTYHMDQPFMFRACRGRRDFSGGRNQHLDYREFRDIPNLARKIKEMVAKDSYTLFS